MSTLIRRLAPSASRRPTHNGSPPARVYVHAVRAYFVVSIIWTLTGSCSVDPTGRMVPVVFPQKTENFLYIFIYIFGKTIEFERGMVRNKPKQELSVSWGCPLPPLSVLLQSGDHQPVPAKTRSSWSGNSQCLCFLRDFSGHAFRA